MLTSKAEQLYRNIEEICEEINQGNQLESSVTVYDCNERKVFGENFKKPSYITARDHACDLLQRLQTLSNEYEELNK